MCWICISKPGTPKCNVTILPTTLRCLVRWCLFWFISDTSSIACVTGPWHWKQSSFLTMTESYVGGSSQADFRATHKLFLRTENSRYKTVLDMYVSGTRIRHVIQTWSICYLEDKDGDDMMTVIMKTTRWRAWRKCNQSHTDEQTEGRSIPLLETSP